MRLEIEAKVDSMQIEMSTAAKKKLLSINLQTVPTTTTVTEKGWSGAAKGAVIGAGVGAVTGAIISKKKRRGSYNRWPCRRRSRCGNRAIIDGSKKK
jgi:hypothetical protein